MTQYKRTTCEGRKATHNCLQQRSPRGLPIHIDPLSSEGLNFQTFLGQISQTKRLATNIFCDVIHLRVKGKKSAGCLPPLHEPQHF